MMRTLILFFYAAFAVNADRPPRIDPAAIQAFNRPYMEFYRRYYGCPPDGKWSIDQCFIGLGLDDLESFRRAREAAKTLFGLR